MMNSRERFLRAVNHEETDRLPLDFPGATKELWAGIKSRFGNLSDEEVRKLLGLDVRSLHGLDFTGQKRYCNGEEADYWGITSKAKNAGDSSDQCPMRDVTSVDQVESYQWPDVKDFNGDYVEEAIEGFSGYPIGGGLWAPIFHNFVWLVGFENSLVWLHTQPEVSAAILRRVTDFWIGCAKKLLELGKGRIDYIDTYNDMGTQNDLLISPEAFRTFLKPELKRLFDVVKGYDAKVFVHSCGSISLIIQDLIDIGCDILDPIQVAAANMSPEFLKSRFGKNIAFHGAIDTQFVLPKGTTDEVRREVRRVAGILGKGGGYILSGSQGFQNDIPVDNILAMYDEARKI